jgi:hypothetical protein
MIFPTAVFFQQKVLKKVAGRTHKDRNVVLRFVGLHKGTNTVARDPQKYRSTFCEVF